MAKIKRLMVKNLNNWGEKGNFDLTFHDDLNIFTGQNGCGKTTLMKLMWYILRGQGDFRPADIFFSTAELEVEHYNSELITFKIEHNKGQYKTDTVYNEKKISYDNFTTYDSGRIIFGALREDNKTCFFPTFRRFEGGFREGEFRKEAPNLSEILKVFSKHLSSHDHQFITAFSTDDLELMIMKNYGFLSEKMWNIENEQDKLVLTESENISGDAKESLVKIQQLIADKKRQKAEVMRPYTKLSKLVEQLFKNKKVTINHGISLGEGENRIDIDKLSAGEKQMLSFLAYNAFLNDAVIFIDEPEMSLHPNWQRKLIPMLMEQNDSNQLFFATHSPFFYAHYPSKEHILDENKGDKA